MPEEQAFYILSRLLKGHDLRSFYTEDMRGVQLRVFQMNRLIQQVLTAFFSSMGIPLILSTVIPSNVRTSREIGSEDLLNAYSMVYDGIHISGNIK